MIPIHMKMPSIYLERGPAGLIPAGPSYRADRLSRAAGAGLASEPSPGMALLVMLVAEGSTGGVACGCTEGGIYAGLAVVAGTPWPGAENPVRPPPWAETGV